MTTATPAELVASVKASLSSPEGKTGKIVGVRPPPSLQRRPTLPAQCPACQCNRVRWALSTTKRRANKKSTSQHSYTCHCGNTLFDEDVLPGGGVVTTAPPRCPRCNAAESALETIWHWVDCRTARCRRCNNIYQDADCRCQHCREEQHKRLEQRNTTAPVPERRRPLGFDGLRRA